MKPLPFVGLQFCLHTPQSFIAYVKSLMNSNASKEVIGVAISIGANNRITIKISRETKKVSRDELTVLATEYKLDEQELLKLFIKRKIEVIYDDNDARRNSEAPIKAKKNARRKKASKQQDPSINQLQQPISDTRLHEESSVPTFEEVEA